MIANQRNRALVALFAGATAIGIGPVFVRYSEVGPGATAFYRVLLALPMFWLWLGLLHRSSSPPRRPTTRWHYGNLALAGLFFAFDLSLWHWSIMKTSVANATLLANLAPLVVTLGAAWLIAEKITRRFWVAMIVAFSGAFLLLGVTALFAADNLVGDGLALATAFFYGAYQLWMKRLRAHFDPITAMSWTGITAVIAFFIIATLTGDDMIPETMNGWGVLLALALVSHLAGQGLIVYAFGHLPASFGSLSLLLQPVVAAGLAWILFGESMGPVRLFGATLVMTGVFLAQRDQALLAREAAKRRRSEELDRGG